MKKLLLLAGFLLRLASFAEAQDNADQNPAGKIEPLKIAYITRKLNLTTEEAQHFWPIYDQYAKELHEARQANKNKTDIEMDEILLNIRKKYNGQLAGALPPQKVNQFFRTEREFNNFVRREWMERSQQRRFQQQQRRPFGNRP
jgi:Skp family chaperone for outer membrane proteins